MWYLAYLAQQAVNRRERMRHKARGPAERRHTTGRRGDGSGHR